MRQLTLKQLEEEFAGRNLEYVFSEEDQSEWTAEHITCLEMVFDTMLVAQDLRAICFKSPPKIVMLLDGVRHVEALPESEIGTVFDIVCQSRNGKPKKYRVWARPRDQ